MSFSVILTWATFLLALTSEPTESAIPEALEEFDIGRDAGPIIVPVTVGSRSYPFVLDTGACVSGFDVTLRSLLGEAVGEQIMNTPAGPARVSMARLQGASVGRLPLGAGSAVMVLDTTFLREATGIEVRGVLGMDFLSQYVVTIDFDRGILRIGSSPGRDGHLLPLKMVRGVPWVEAEISGAGSVSMMVDTGMIAFSTLDYETYRGLEQGGKIRSAGENLGISYGGRERIREGRLDSLKLGPFKHRSLCLHTATGLNALGLSFWARYTPTFDFPSQVAYLRPSSRHAIPEYPGGSGLGLLCRDGRCEVVGVKEGSPAARAGLREGDELLSVDGRSFGECSIPVLGRQLCGEGRTVRLVFRRGDEIHELPIQLEASWRTALPAPAATGTDAMPD